MQDPSRYDNPGFYGDNPTEKQDHSNPPPPYYPPVASAPPPAPYYQPYYPPAPYPPAPYQPGPYQPAPAVQQPLVCQQSTNVVVVNPQGVLIRPRHRDYLCWSIMNFICCCWPLGLAAIIFSCKTRSDDDRNDERAASCSSKTALSLNITALVTGVIVYIVVCVMYSQYY